MSYINKMAEGINPTNDRDHHYYHHHHDDDDEDNEDHRFLLLHPNIRLPPQPLTYEKGMELIRLRRQGFNFTALGRLLVHGGHGHGHGGSSVIDGRAAMALHHGFETKRQARDQIDEAVFRRGVDEVRKRPADFLVRKTTAFAALQMYRLYLDYALFRSGDPARFWTRECAANFELAQRLYLEL